MGHLFQGCNRFWPLLKLVGYIHQLVILLQVCISSTFHKYCPLTSHVRYSVFQPEKAPKRPTMVAIELPSGSNQGSMVICHSATTHAHIMELTWETRRSTTYMNDGHWIDAAV